MALLTARLRTAHDDVVDAVRGKPRHLAERGPDRRGAEFVGAAVDQRSFAGAADRRACRRHDNGLGACQAPSARAVVSAAPDGDGGVGHVDTDDAAAGKGMRRKSSRLVSSR
jgi:hypothetical protein